MQTIDAHSWDIDAGGVQKLQIISVCSALMRGGVIGYPTETVYGLGCDALQESAARRIIALKGRGAGKGLLVLVRDSDQVNEIAEEVPPVANRLMEIFWPGPLTLIFKASHRLPVSVTGGTGSVGVRISSDPVCRQITEQFDRPFVSTSANPAGSEPAVSAVEVAEYFGGQLDLIVDGGVRRSEHVSTIIDIRSARPRLIRKGVITLQEIEQQTGVIFEI